MRRESRRQDAEIPTAIRPRDTNGHTAESPRTRSHTDMLAYTPNTHTETEEYRNRSGRENSVTTEGGLLAATLGLVTPHARKSITEKKHENNKNHTVKQTP